MSGSEINNAILSPGLYRQQDSKWIAGLSTLAYGGMFLLLCGFYLAPKVAGVQTAFYLTLLPAALLLMLWRRDYRFIWSWQFAAFCTLPLVLALSTLWASADVADVQRKTSFYFKLVLYLALFYCGTYLVLERRGDRALHQWLLALIAVGLVSGLASLITYGLDDDLLRFRRIRGISLEGDIDKTGLLFGFHALFCCYGIAQSARPWRWLSWSGLVVSCLYIVLSQTKLPLVMALCALLLAAFISGSRLLRGLLLLAALAALPLGYLALFGDLPLLHRSNAYSVRLELWGQAWREFVQAPLLGSGLVHKQFIKLHHLLPHPHNYLLDVARFSGLLGLTACAWQGLGAVYTVLSREQLLTWIPGLIAAWFGFGTLAMAIYAQQPLVKPSYIWFFYWIPLALLLARSQLQATVLQKASSRQQLPSQYSGFATITTESNK
ncbi:O-antigen ligase family protein [Microbulbifer sp. 2201CG32-9]|uniref:O-antigen ligase family protein n=1 Tax=Microbulbifer sp. 2201CG32-9 TaxID=3232309 RepID=UPI00345B9BF5